MPRSIKFEPISMIDVWYFLKILLQQKQRNKKIEGT